MRKCYFLLLTLWLFSCDNSRIYEEFQEVDKYWRTDQTLAYTFDIEDEQADYVVIAHFKNDLTYPYRNFYFNYRLQMEDDVVLSERLEQIQLFEPKTGKPYGSGIGDQYNHELVLEESIQFPVAGNYQIDLSQFMRVDSLVGIQRIGVRIEIAR